MTSPTGQHLQRQRGRPSMTLSVEQCWSELRRLDAELRAAPSRVAWEEWAVVVEALVKAGELSPADAMARTTALARRP